MQGELGFITAHQIIKRALKIPGANKPEMRKQRKMGYVTIVGPSLGIVEAQLNFLLAEESIDNQPAAAPRVGIIMGPDSDLPVMKVTTKILNEFGVGEGARTRVFLS